MSFSSYLVSFESAEVEVEVEIEFEFGASILVSILFDSFCYLLNCAFSLKKELVL